MKLTLAKYNFVDVFCTKFSGKGMAV